MEKMNTRKFVLVHLSVILGCILPLGNVWGPLLISNRENNLQLRASVVNIVNFQILWSIILIVALIVFWYRQIVNLSKSEEIQPYFLAYVVLAGLIVNLLYPILVSVIIGITKKAKLYYPTLIKFMK